MECPGCHTDIYFKYCPPRWNSKTTCPKCNTKLFVQYDLIWMEEENDEWDLYDLILLSESIYKDDKIWLEEEEFKIQ